MEKTNKYYGVIEDLVKQNRKYQGLEPILDDIIDDVYSHSEVIINSINNDSVIQSYLAKVVSTSVITVPKRLGFQPEVQRKTVDAQQVLENVVHKQEKAVNTVLVDKMINNIAFDDKEEEPSLEESLSLEELEVSEPQTPVTTLEELEVSEPQTPVTTLETASETVNENKDLLISNDDKLEIEAPKIDAQDEISVSDNELNVLIGENDNEISDVDAQTEIVNETTESTEPETIQESEQVSLELNDLDKISEEEETQHGTTDEIQTSEEVDSIELEPVLADDSTLEISDEPLLQNDEIEIHDEETLDLQQDDSTNFNSLDIEDLNSVEEDSDTFEANDLEILNSDDTSDVTLDIQGDNNLELLETSTADDSPLDVISDNGLNQIADVITTTLENPGNTSSENTDFKPTDYSVFSYSTDKYKDDIDAEEIINEIKDLASKHPELNIIDVYNLKFKDKLTVPQVASELNMSEDNVIEALNELVAIVQ